VHDVASFDGEVLASDAHTYDPETLAPASPLAPKEPPVEAADARYRIVVGGFGLVGSDPERGDVEEVASGHLVVQAGPCAAGGLIDFTLSSTGRFLICASNRGGLTLRDLRSPDPGEPIGWAADGGPRGEGLAVSPNDTYAVAVPVLTWGGDVPSRDSIAYYNLDRRTSVTLSRAPAPERSSANPYDVAFCGTGAVFAVSGLHELTLYRGDNGMRLTGAPAKKGGRLAFSASGRYLSRTWSGWTTVFRLR
jgi:hypothetical protein